MMTFRGMLFWAMDTLRGGPVRKHLKEIKVILEDDSDDSRRDKLLSTQLSYVTSSVPYYRDLHGTLDLAKFPVVNKMKLSSFLLVRGKASSLIINQSPKG